MAYDVYLGKMMLPVTPSEITLSIGNKNTSIVLINDGEVNLLKAAGLTEIRFTALIPQVQYNFARYSGGFTGAKTFLDYFEQLKTSCQPFQFIVSRCLPSGKLLFDTNLSVSLESYTVKEDAKQGFDLTVEFSLKQYRAYGTKTVQMETLSETAPVIVQENRPENTSPDAPKPNNQPASSGKYSTVKLTVSRGGSIDGGNYALSTYTVSPGETVAVLPRARRGYSGDYFTYNGTKKTGAWSLTPTGNVGTIEIKVFYKKTSSSSTANDTASQITSTTQRQTTTVPKRPATGNKTVSSRNSDKVMVCLN